MCDDALKQRSLSRQVEMFRLAERDHDLPQARIARITGFHPNTVGGWARGETAMGLHSFVELCKHLPDSLVSIMLEPANKAVHSLEATGCFDELAAASHGYLADHTTARNDNSPGGPAIVHCEKLSLVKRARHLHEVSGRVIAAHGVAE